MFIYTLCVFLTEFLCFLTQAIPAFGASADLTNVIWRYQYPLYDASNCLPPWFMIVMSSSVRNEIRGIVTMIGPNSFKTNTTSRVGTSSVPQINNSGAMLKNPAKKIENEPIPTKKPRFSIDGILASSKTSKTSLMEPSSSSPEAQEADSDQEDSSPASAPKGNWIPSGNSQRLGNVVCKLEGKELWSKFYNLSTEMIITKSGRSPGREV
ncbi:hypothetical protein FO519_002347 [Halicephalobus sp. NKZ332]|nr:hypothetical protein FO519_002347 [Halicephalobus sp. NKZ332]